MAKQLPKHLEGYAMVEDRLPLFYAQFPDGRIISEVVAHTDDSIITRSFIYRNAEDQEKNIPLSTGICKEIFTPKMPKYVENCETSSIGRALANYNIRGADEEGNQAKRPRLEEMQSVEALQDVAPPPATQVPSPASPPVTPPPAQPEMPLADNQNSLVEEAVALGGTLVSVQSEEGVPMCPEHQITMVWKSGTNSRGPWGFWGCPMFPQCTNKADKDGNLIA